MTYMIKQHNLSLEAKLAVQQLKAIVMIDKYSWIASSLRAINVADAKQ